MDALTLINAIVRGDEGCVEHLAHVDGERLRQLARQHGVLPLVADRLAGWRGVPPAVGEHLQAEARGFTAVDLLREGELRRVLDALAAADVDALVLKGAALAYSHYERPDLRPRDDTDVLIAPEARTAAHAVLLGLGYRAHDHVAGTLVSYQAIYEIARAGLTRHTIDLHWRIVNPQVFAGVLEFDEARAAAVPLGGLGRHAHGLSGVHALLLACVHRVAHHRDDDLLIWLYDVHLIASALTPDEWTAVVDLARHRRVLAICRHGLRRAAATFGTVVPAIVFDDSFASGEVREQTTAFLRRDRAQLATFVSDLRALRDWRSRGRLVREHLFPPEPYMRQVYAPASRAPLPMLYAWRAVRGVWRWVGRG